MKIELGIIFIEFWRMIIWKWDYKERRISTRTITLTCSPGNNSLPLGFLQFILKLKILNKILKRAVNFFSDLYLYFSWSAVSCFARNVWLNNWLKVLRFEHKLIVQYYYRLKNQLYCLKILRIFIVRIPTTLLWKMGWERLGK